MNMSKKNWTLYIRIIRELITISFLGICIILIIGNWNSINVFIQKVLTSSANIAIGDIITVSMSTNSGKDDGNVGEMQAFYKVKKGIRISAVEFNDKSTKYEFIELQALQELNLTRGFIGDDNEVLFLGERELKLAPYETVRIYTFLKSEDNKVFISKIEKEIGRKVVLSQKVVEDESSEDDGIFKNEPGEGDRIVVLDHQNNLLIDAHYWWLSPPTKK